MIRFLCTLIISLGVLALVGVSPAWAQAHQVHQQHAPSEPSAATASSVDCFEVCGAVHQANPPDEQATAKQLASNTPTGAAALPWVTFQADLQQTFTPLDTIESLTKYDHYTLHCTLLL